VQLPDGRIVTNNLKDDDIYVWDSEYNPIKVMRNAIWIKEMMLHENTILCTGYTHLYTLNIDTEKIEENTETTVGWDDMIKLKNGSIALIRFNKMYIISNWKIIEEYPVEMEYQQQVFAEVYDNVVGYYNKSSQIVIHDCVTGEIQLYDIPKDLTFLSFIFE
jgi:hypothetical protein